MSPSPSFFILMIHSVFFPFTYHLLIFYSNLLSLSDSVSFLHLFFFISAAVPVITPSFWLLSPLPQYPFYCLCLLPSSPPLPLLLFLPPLHPPLLPAFPSFFLPCPQPPILLPLHCAHPSSLLSFPFHFAASLPNPGLNSLSFLPFPPPNPSTSRFAASVLEQG